MGAIQKYVITVECDTPPQVMLGQSIFGGKVISLQQEDLPTFVSVTWLMQRFNMSRANILEKLKGHNKGSDGKHLYETKIAITLLSDTKTCRGRKRIN